MSSYQLLGPILTLAADATMVGLMYRAMAVGSDGEFQLASAGGAVVAISTDKPAAAGQACPGQIYGVAEVDLGGTVTAGDRVKSDASGKAVTASAAEVQAGLSFGLALEGGANGGRAPVLLTINGAGVGGGGYLDVALDTDALDSANLYDTIFVGVDGTKSADLPNGVRAGQRLTIVIDTATNTPDGTINGTFLTQAGAAATALDVDAAGEMAEFVWTGAAWRAVRLTTATLS